MKHFISLGRLSNNSSYCRSLQFIALIKVKLTDLQLPGRHMTIAKWQDTDIELNAVSQKTIDYRDYRWQIRSFITVIDRVNTGI